MEKNKNNMSLWESVEKTNPKYTKSSPRNGGQTSIKTQYQALKATNAFGPIGKGWGFDTTEPVYNTNEATKERDVTIGVRFWWVDDDGKHFVPGETGYIYTSDYLHYLNSKGEWKLDDDALKKATTDALTKCLSYLGFSADVFLGMYDNPGYVAMLNTYFNKLSDEQYDEVKALIDKVSDKKMKQKFTATLEDGKVTKKNIEASKQAIQSQIDAEKKAKEAKLTATNTNGVGNSNNNNKPQNN